MFSWFLFFCFFTIHVLLAICIVVKKVVFCFVCLCFVFVFFFVCFFFCLFFVLFSILFVRNV